MGEDIEARDRRSGRGRGKGSADGSQGVEGEGPLERRSLDALPDALAVLPRSLLARAAYGGMEGDMAMLHNAAHVWHDRLQPNPSEGASAAAGSGSGGGGSRGGGGGVLASRGNEGDAAASAPYWYLSPQMLDDLHRLNHPWLSHIFEGVYVHARARCAYVLRFACAGRVRVRGRVLHMLHVHARQGGELCCDTADSEIQPRISTLDSLETPTSNP